MLLALDEAVVEHPVIVVQLGQVLVAGVADQGHHALAMGLLAAIAQRRGDQGAGGRATQHAFLRQQLARGEEALLVGDRVGLLDPGEVADARQEVLADAFDHPAGGLGRERALVDVLRQDRANRIGQDQLGLRRMFGEELRQPAQRAGRAAADHHGIYLAVHLLQDLRTGAGDVRGRVVGVAELVDEVGAGRLAGDPLGHVLVVLGVALGHVGAGQHHLGAHRLEVEDLLPAHLVRHHQDQPVALLLRDQGQAQAGVAGGALDQDVARADAPVLLGALDHRQADAVLDRAAGVGALELQEQLARSRVEASRANHRGVSDQFEDTLVNRHGGSVAGVAASAQSRGRRTAMITEPPDTLRPRQSSR